MLERPLERPESAHGNEEKEGKKEHEHELTSVVRVVEILGTSKVSFDDAIETAIKRAAETIRHISGVDVKHMTLGVEDGKITEYRVDLKMAFPLEKEED